jgi:hypothetical protein
VAEAVLIAIATMAAGANAATLFAGNALTATFTIAPNNADMLFLSDNTPLTETGCARG